MAELDGHFVTRENTNEVAANLSRYMGQYFVTVLQFDLELRVGERFYHSPLYFYAFFFIRQFDVLPHKPVGQLPDSLAKMVSHGNPWFVLARE